MYNNHILVEVFEIVGGFMGKILRIDLTTGTTKVEPIDEKIAKDYIGGRGYASKIIYDEVDPNIDPLSPDNLLIFATGPVTGLPAPAAGRYMVVTKGLLTGTIASSNSGGDWGVALKSAGYDMVIIKGKAEKPVYIWIDEDKVEIRDASHLWGKNTHETTDKIVEENGGDRRIKVACIGPAGENLVKFACVINDKNRAAGRTGVGAIMGSKNLKAIAAVGKKRPQVANKEKWQEALKASMDKVRSNDVTSKGLPTYGTKVLDSIINENGLYPTKNFQTGVFSETEKVNGETLREKYLVRNVACWGCPIACGRKTKLPNGREGEGPEYEVGWAYGADLGISDLEAIVEANYLSNELGLDPISAGGTIACAMELYERGYLPKDKVDGPELKFGSTEALLTYVKKIAYREGLGDELAEGSYRFAEKYGHPELSMSVKKQELPAYDPRGAQGHALEYATSNRGGCHVRGYMISPEILGIPEKLDPQELKGKPEWVKIFQDLTAVIDSMGMCLFTSFALGAPDYAALLSAVTGFDYSPEEALKAGERIWNLERLFNLKAGFTKADDTLPPRLLHDPMPDGPNKGAVAHIDKLLPEYYKVRGWDENGVPTETKKKELGLA